MIRLILVVLFLTVYFILSIPTFLILWIVGKINPGTKDIVSLRIVQGAFKIILFLCGTKVTVIGEEHVPDEPVLFIGNHRSYFDILITYSRCKRLTGYVAKKEIAKIPLLATWMRLLKCQFLDRDNVKEGLKTILACIALVKQGVSICIFPEGTRNKGEELSLLPFKEGAMKIADKTGCAIVPMSLNNTVQIFEAHAPFIHRTHVVLEYGEPIYPANYTKEERKRLGETCSDLIRETINRNAPLV